MRASFVILLSVALSAFADDPLIIVVGGQNATVTESGGVYIIKEDTGRTATVCKVADGWLTVWSTGERSLTTKTSSGYVTKNYAADSPVKPASLADVFDAGYAARAKKRK